MTRRRVRLSRTHWYTISLALAFLSRESAVVRGSVPAAEIAVARRVLRRIGWEGMAASRRGVAPVRKER